MKRNISIILFVMALILSSQAQAATCRVGAARPFVTITAALEAAPCTTIIVDAGLYHETLNINRAVRLVGSGADSTIINGSGLASSVINITAAGNAVVTDFTITNGSGEEGAGLYNAGRLRLIDSKVINNTARTYGGGLYCERGNVIIEDSTFSFNQANSGGAIYGGGCTEVSISDSTVENNEVESCGGGIYSIKGLLLSGVTISNNVANNDGGGVWVSGPTVIVASRIEYNQAVHFGGGLNFETEMTMASLNISTTTLNANSAYVGGGITLKATDFIAPAVTIDSSLFTENIATATRSDGGGGLYSTVDFSLTNSTIVNNGALSGAGIYQTCATEEAATHNVQLNNVTVFANRPTDGVGEGGGGISLSTSTPDTCEITVSFSNTLVSNNEGGDCLSYDPENLISLGNNLSPDVNCRFVTATDITALADLADLADNGGPTLTIMPNPGSPVIDAGNTATCESIDQRGIIRPLDGNDDGVVTCDIGAVEVE